MELKQALMVATEMQKWRTSQPPYHLGDDPATRLEMPYTGAQFTVALNSLIALAEKSFEPPDPPDSPDSPDDWQAMDTAPRDGSEIIVAYICDGGHGVTCVDDYEVLDGIEHWGNISNCYILDDLYAWRPLPEPPAPPKNK